MPNPNNGSNIMDELSRSIDMDTGNIQDDNLDQISNQFDRSLADALKTFNSASFDDDGFIAKMHDLNLDGSDRDVVKSVLNNIKNEYVSVDALNQNEILLRRDINNICSQMPEMHDVVTLMRDSVCEGNTATGEISRSLHFANTEDNEACEAKVKEIEKRFNLLYAIHSFIVPNVIKSGEMYVHIVPFSKVFAELELLNDQQSVTSKKWKSTSNTFKESIPNVVREYFTPSMSMYSDENVKALVESVGVATNLDSVNDINSLQKKESVQSEEKIASANIGEILKNIDVYNGSSEMMAEMGLDGLQELALREYHEYRFAEMQYDMTHNPDKAKEKKFNAYMEAYMDNGMAHDTSTFAKLDQDDIDISSYKSIKGCYVKYMDPAKMVPIRMDRRVIGYYYVTTTMDLQSNPGHPNGMVDLSYQQYTKDKNMVGRLANMIIRSFDKKFLDNNIKLKNEIVDIIMAHKFTEGKLSFIFIPENEIVRFTIDEDENGKGHSILEPTLFPARSYLMLNLYNMLYTLNNNTTRIHYLKSSGLNKDYASQIQRTIRKFQSRRITIDDIYSYSGVLNKIGGMGEMVLPAGRGDYKALETDTIEAANNPISTEFLEQQRRQAISGTGAPHLLMINAIDEVDFAKTLELANARYLSRVGGIKVMLNNPITKMYKILMKHCTDIDPDIIESFTFTFDSVRQQDLNITSDMISNFNTLVELVSLIYYNENQLKEETGKNSYIMKNLKKELAKKYLPQLDFDELDRIIDEVEIQSTKDALADKVKEADITEEDTKEVSKKKKKEEE